MKYNAVTTPIYHKLDPNAPWPADKFFYLVAQEGLFLCRNHPFFQSCVKIETGPKHLASQKEFMRMSYPSIPRALLERAVGFFQLVADKQNSEAAVILVYRPETKKVELIVPDQKAINSAAYQGQPHGYPMDVKYEIPPLPKGTLLIGDIHSHVDGSAYASMTDETDELHRPGVHIVVGHINDEPPSFHCEVVVDGTRFEAKLDEVTEGYEKRRKGEVPKDWVEKVKLEVKTYGITCGGDYYGYGANQTNYPTGELRTATSADKKIIQFLLDGFLKEEQCPTMIEVRHDLFRGTKEASYLYCERRAEQFVREWPKRKAKYAKQPAA